MEYHILLSEKSAQIFNEKSQQDILKIQILYETEKKEKETEIYRLRNIELAKANATKGWLNDSPVSTC